MELIKSLILFGSAFLGGMAVFFVTKSSTKNLKLILSFSGAYLFAICALHLMPEVYSSHNPMVGVFVLVGFAFQIILEQFSEGVEHGHIHVHHHEHGAAFPFGLMISLCLHAFLEALPLASSEAQNELLFGIAIHHIPAAFALGSILLQSNISKSTTIMMLALFALMSPAGFILSQNLGPNASGALSQYFDYIMAIVIGIFLHISTTILFEASEDHKFNLYKTIAIFLGAGIAITIFFLQDSHGHVH
ncbi:ZIP family metal transporter [Solitalea canadensis]|uniref:Putative divalent heavy-metal cations transporter n=1 Tax=Solitalea canadensis (strain ATCC 29591 / DSM 3403 / JCM 21819 / LMG 8368 / NBRC 15130 / NCIMB 12057 / USAM 9D) TaxID=929556 RepID=H8KRA7_SOLCM|nr:ZIP family metal transporter [Solitalea canadensis]AFD07374.1 putative divalent heavy-metal cations transporter [Solitalea canadensis DSM 3403]